MDVWNDALVEEHRDVMFAGIDAFWMWKVWPYSMAVSRDLWPAAYNVTD